MRSAPSADQCMPVRFMRCWTTWATALSIKPLPMCRPASRKVFGGPGGLPLFLVFNVGAVLVLAAILGASVGIFTVALQAP